MAYLDRSAHEHQCMAEVATTAAGTALDVSEYRNVIFAVATDGGGDYNGTIKFQGAIMETEPTWASAQSKANIWDYIEVVDLEDGTALDGDTGMVVAGADDVRLFEMNTNGLTWVNARQTARAAGEINVYIRAYKN